MTSAAAAAAAATTGNGGRHISKLFSVAGRNVLVTGGSRGIGFMIAQGFAAAGANVVLTSRDERACAEAAEQCGGGGGGNNNNNKTRYVASNVSTREGCEELAAAVDRMLDGQRLDVLVNNAGTSWGEPLDRASSKKANWGFDKVLDLNVKGIFYLTRACLPLMKREAAAAASSDVNDETTATTATDPARVINVGSVAGMVPQEAPTHAYDVSKAAVHHLTRKLAADLAPHHITVNCLAPGFVPSRMSAGLAAWTDGDDVEAKLAAKIPLRRMGQADDMAGACIYLASPAASWCTGVVLHVDGGTVGAMQIPLSSL